MIPCISTKLSKTYIKEKVDSIVRCASCHNGFFREYKCFYCCKKIQIARAKAKERDLIISLKKKIQKKKDAIMRRKSKKCLICGEGSGNKICCSKICDIRYKCAVYIKNGIEYISIEEAQRRLDGMVERKRLRNLQNSVNIK